MAGIREAMQRKPWIGWALSVVLLAAAAYFYVSRGRNLSAYNPDRMRESVTVKYADTGDEVQMPRGRFERALRESQQGAMDPAKGLINPKSGQPTGFLFDKTDWDETVARINKERAQLQGGAKDAKSAPATPKGVTTAPTPKLGGDGADSAAPKGN